MLSFLYNKTTTSNESFSWFKPAKNTITSFTTAGNHKVGFEDILYMLESETTKNKMSNRSGYHRQKEDAIFLLINTLPMTSQHCLIPKTIPYHMEEKIINDILNDASVQPLQYYIVLYGKHSTDDSVDKKYRQLIQLGFTNVFIYYGGLFEWMLLRDIYGEDKFPLHTSDNKKDTYGCGNAYSEGRRRSPEEYDVLSMRPPSKFSQIGNVT
jgi:hypothetical protein